MSRQFPGKSTAANRLIEENNFDQNIMPCLAHSAPMIIVNYIIILATPIDFHYRGSLRVTHGAPYLSHYRGTNRQIKQISFTTNVKISTLPAPLLRRNSMMSVDPALAAWCNTDLPFPSTTCIFPGSASYKRCTSSSRPLPAA